MEWLYRLLRRFRPERSSEPKEKLFALFSEREQKFVSHNPIDGTYNPVDQVEQLHIWDVWDEAMIPHVLNEKFVKDRYVTIQLTRAHTARLSFKLL
jgi:hypothetical protein